MTFATKRTAARLFLPGAALPLCPVLTSAAGRARETAEAYASPVSKGLADTSILQAEDGCWYPHGTGESLRGREGSPRVNPTVPALLI
jgi:hypothetical protein